MKCQAYVITGSKFCFRHDSKQSSKARTASSKGGNARKTYIHLDHSISIKTPEDIKKLMALSLNKLLSGEMHASNPANSLGYLSKVFLEAYDKSDLEVRIVDIEKKLLEIKA